MTTNNYAYYNKTTGLIENVLLIESSIAPALEWPDGYAVVVIPDELHGEWSVCGIGWFYLEGQFSEPVKPEFITPTNQPISIGAQTL